VRLIFRGKGERVSLEGRAFRDFLRALENEKRGVDGPGRRWDGENAKSEIKKRVRTVQRGRRRVE